MTVGPRLRLFALTILSSTVLGAALSGAADPVRITAAANVTLRQAPNPGASAVAYLPLGTEVTEAGPPGMDKTWVHVRLADGREGWLLASAARPIDPRRRWPVIEQIVQDRLGRRGDSFPALVELADFVERVSRDVPDAETDARFDLYRLRAVSAGLAAIPFRKADRDPYLSWLDRHKALAVYDEPGGRWILANAAVWQAHDRHPDAAAADDLAWLTVTNGLPGECEGVVTCYLDWQNRLPGEYLRRHPSGRHADAAVLSIKETVDRLLAPAPAHALQAFSRDQDCRALTATVAALSSAVSAARAVNRDETLQSLKVLNGWCK